MKKSTTQNNMGSQNKAIRL